MYVVIGCESTYPTEINSGTPGAGSETARRKYLSEWVPEQKTRKEGGESHRGQNVITALHSIPAPMPQDDTPWCPSHYFIRHNYRFLGITTWKDFSHVTEDETLQVTSTWSWGKSQRLFTGLHEVGMGGGAMPQKVLRASEGKK